MLRRAFTLVEIAIATAIIGVGIVALMGFMGTGTKATGESVTIAQAITLANNIHEMACRMPIADSYGGQQFPFARPEAGVPGPNTNLLWLDGWTFSGPCVDSQGKPLTNRNTGADLFPGWKQKCSVRVFDISNPGQTPAPAASNSNARLLKITIEKHGVDIYSTTAILAPTVPQ